MGEVRWGECASSDAQKAEIVNEMEGSTQNTEDQKRSKTVLNPALHEVVLENIILRPLRAGMARCRSGRNR